MLGKLIPVQGGDSIYLTLPEVTVGSDEGCDVVIQHRSIEPLHCTLEYHDGTWFVEDHGTRSGVRVDGDLFDSTYIPVYSVLSIGTVQFEVHYRAGAPVTVGADSEASNVWPSVAGETGPQYSSGGRVTDEEDELLLAPDDDSGLNLNDSQDGFVANAQAESPARQQRPTFKRLGFLSPIDGETPHRLRKERLYLGRDSECDVVVSGLDVAPLHCVMELRDGYWHVRNLRDNGVAIDGKKLSESWLLPGAVLSICGHEFSVDYEPEGTAPAVAAEPDEVAAAAQNDLNSTVETGRTVAVSEPSTVSNDAASADDSAASDIESALSLAELAAEADELFATEAEPNLNAFVAEPPPGEVQDTDSPQPGAAEPEASASNDSTTFVASSKTFLLFENPEDEAAATIPAVSPPPMRERPKSVPKDAPRSSGTSATGGNSDDTDFELTTRSANLDGTPGLFSEDGDAGSASTSSIAEIRKPRRSRAKENIPRPASSSPLFPDSAGQASAGGSKLSAAATLTNQRHKRLAEYLAANSLDGVVITRPSTAAWLTAGTQSWTGLAGSAALVVTRDERSIVTRDMDAASLAKELASELQFNVKPYAWHESLADQLERVCATGRFAFDGEKLAQTVDASAELSQMRLPMERPERRELRRLGHQVAHAVEATLRNFHRGATEAEIAGQLSNRLFRHGITAEQIQIYADDRRGDYRRATFDRRPVEDGCTLSVTVRRNGLHIAASRTMCFGTPDRSILDDHSLSLVVQATSLAFSKHEWPIADVWKRVHRIYEKFDRADEALTVEPGWVTGYERCEAPILPHSNFQLLAGMPVIWQAGVGTALSVDTVLIANGGIDILTPCDFWPTRRVAVKRIELQRPDILIRNDS